MKIPILEDEKRETLTELGICHECQDTHSVNVARLHLSYYCSHSQRAILMVGGWASVSDGLAMNDYVEFITNLQRRVSGVLN